MIIWGGSDGGTSLGGGRYDPLTDTWSPISSTGAPASTRAGRLASKSPMLMRLGHDAMYRQQDMALDDALEYLRSQLSLTFTTEDIVEGAQAFFEKREPNWKGR